MPTYIEYGNRLRLVYLLNEGGVKLPNPQEKERREATLIFLDRVQAELVKCINELDCKYNAEVNSYTSFVRIPGSINRKYIGYIGPDGKYHWQIKSKDRVCAMEIANGKRWDFHELAEQILPKLPDWYADYKKRQQKKLTQRSTRTYSSSNLIQLMKKRLHLLEQLQQDGYDIGHREMMCHLYFNCLLQMKQLSREESWELVRKFNSDFRTPLNERKLKISIYKGKEYNYKDVTFLKKLDLDPEQAARYGFRMRNWNSYTKQEYREYRREYMRQYRKDQKPTVSDKQKEILRLSQKAKELRESGCTVRQIADELGISESTVKRYLAK